MRRKEEGFRRWKTERVLNEGGWEKEGESEREREMKKRWKEMNDGRAYEIHFKMEQ